MEKAKMEPAAETSSATTFQTAMTVVEVVRRRIELLYSTNRLSGEIFPQSDFKELDSKLNTINGFLMMNNTNHGTMEKAIRLAYDLEDAVDHLYSEQHQDQFSKLIKQLVMPSQDQLPKQKYSSVKSKFPWSKGSHYVFQSLKVRVNDLIKLCIKDAHDQSAPETWPEAIDFTDSHVSRKLVIPMDSRILEGHLLQGKASTAKVISICGPSGIGKTTLAKQVFDSSTVTQNFDSRAWVEVGRNFHAREIAASILLQLTSTETTKKEIRAMQAMELMERIYKVQEHKRCLVVLDDIRDVGEFDTVRFAFALQHGTRILITTRLDEKDVPKVDHGCVYSMEPLSTERGWKILDAHLTMKDRDVIANANHGDEIEEDIEQEVVKNICGGLPLAVTVFGGLVRGNLLDWYAKLHQKRQTGDAPDVLSLSFNQLPFLLRSCFLYLGHLPINRATPVEKLYLMWIAEGLIIPTEDHKSRMEMAEDYLLALVQRRLVIVNTENHTAVAKIKSCKLHDKIRNLCISEGNKEGFLLRQDLDQKNKLPSMRKITIQLEYNSAYYASHVSELKHVRSLLFFQTDAFDQQQSKLARYVNLKEFHWARILDFDSVDFRYRKLPRGIERLVYLRYLSFHGCHLEELPSSFSMFPLLETLDLRVIASCTMIIPDILSHMSCLMHLYFPLLYRSATREKLRLVGLERLEILENFHAGVCNAEDLQSLTSIRVFKGIADGDNEQVNKMLHFITCRQEQQQMGTSSILVKNFDCYSPKRSLIVQKLFTYQFLQALDIQGHLGEIDKQDWSNSKITELTLNGSEFSDDPMPILGKFQKLRSLILCNDAFVGKKLVCTPNSFPELTSLKLSNLSIEEFKVDTGAMPCLSSLTIKQCQSLKMLSSDLAGIATLQEVIIKQMNEEFLKRFKSDINVAKKWRSAFYYN